MQEKDETKKTEAVETVTVETTETVEPEKETTPHKAKRYLRVVIIFAIFFIGGSIIGEFLSDVLAFDKKQQELLKEEIAEIGVLTNAESYDYEALNAMLEETVTSEEYVPLETAIKSFTRDVLTVTATVETAMTSDVVENALTAENISADGPNFTNTLAELDALYTTLETAKTDFQTLMTEEKILSYLPEDTDEELVAVYKEIVSGIKMTPTDTRYINMIDGIDKMLAMIDAERAAINYLVENQSSWKLEAGYIYFDTQEQVSAYNELLAAFAAAAE